MQGTRVKKRIFAGCTCDQIVYTASVRSGEVKEKRIRFKTEEERAEHRRLIARRHCARLVNTNCTPAGYYCTLTFDKENECHTFDEARAERTKFRRRLMRRCPDGKLFLFMGRGSNTSRIHLHMICDGVTAEAIAESWTAGDVIEIRHLRDHNTYVDKESKEKMDVGADLTAVANYCFDHWKPEQGGHYYSRAGEISQPEEEEPTVCVRNYSRENPPVAPKGFRLVSAYATQYGYMCFHYVKIPMPEKLPEKQRTQKRKLNLPI